MGERIKVAHLIKGLGRGGAEVLIRDGVAGSNGRFDMTIGYFLPWKDALAGELRDAGATVRCFDAHSELAMLGRLPQVVRWLRDERVDVLHCHLPLSAVVGRLAGKLAGCPVVYTEHNLQERYRRATRLANRVSWRLQSRVIAVSDPVAASIARHGLPANIPVDVIHNGVDVNRFSASQRSRDRLRRELGIPPSAIVIGTVAVMRIQKRLDLWLDVAVRVSAAEPRARFLLVGDGPLRTEIETRAGEIGLAEKVLFTGLREDPLPFYRAMDIYLMSSDFEGLPVALIEAMACKCAPVCTKAGGIPEVISHGEHGLLVSVGDVDGLANAVERLIGDRGLRGRLAADARCRVEQAFSLDRMLARVEACYERAALGARDNRRGRRRQLAQGGTR